MQPTQDIELAQMFDTEGGETIGDNLADSNVRADKDEEEKKKSTQSTHSEVAISSFLFQLCPK